MAQEAAAPPEAGAPPPVQEASVSPTEVGATPPSAALPSAAPPAMAPALPPAALPATTTPVGPSVDVSSASPPAAPTLGGSSGGPVLGPSPAGPPKVSAALGQGLTVASSDGNFTLQLRTLGQLRYTQTLEDRGPSAPLGHGEEFLVRRLRVFLRGRLYGPDVEYFVHLGLGTLDLEPDRPIPLFDAYLTWRVHRALAVRFGQMKVPFGVQRVMSAAALQLADGPSVVNEYTLDRDAGILVYSDGVDVAGHLAYFVGLFGGDGRNRQMAAVQPLPDQRADRNVVPGVMPVARLVLRPWGQYEGELTEGDLLRGSKPRLSLGASASYNANSSRPRSILGTPYTFARFSDTQVGLDLSFKWRGASLLSEFYERWTDRLAKTNPLLGSTGGLPPGAVSMEYSRPGWGAFAQAGWMLPGIKGWEVTGRYGEVHPANDLDASQRRLTEAAAGLTWYLHGQELKLQADVARYRWLGADEEPAQPDRWQSHVQAQFYF